MIRISSRSLSLALLGAGLAFSVVAAGCSSAASLFYVNKNPQAIERDTITSSGTATFIQNPQDQHNGVVRLVPIQPVTLVPVTVQVPANAPKPFDKPRTLNVPAGFSASVVAADLGTPHDVVVRGDGTLFYSDIQGGKVVALKQDGSKTIIVDGLSSPHGLELHNGALYYADENNIGRFDFSSPNAITGKTTIISDKLPQGGLNYTRTIRWSPNDKRFYVSVGSYNNKSVPDNPMHATVLRMPEAGGKLDVAMRGLRNTVGMDINPETGELWGIDQGTEWISPDLPPDEINILHTGRNYGFPFFYSQNFRDPDYSGADTSRYPRTSETPVIELQADSGPIDLQFYTGDALGAQWKNAMLITLHGSLHREPVAGNKVVMIRSSSTGSGARQADFVTGFINAEGERWGQPTAIAISADGKSFYIADDRAGAIYKVYKP